MDYDKIPGCEEYADIQANKFSQMKRIENSPMVIFLDGKDATKKHNYQMLGAQGFSRVLMDSAKTVLRLYSGPYTLYSIMDEITCIFPEGLAFGDFLKEDTEGTALTLFCTRISKEFSKTYDCDFKGVLYYTPDPGKEIELRRLAGQATALEYFAKEFLSSGHYHGKTIEEIKQEIKEAGLWEAWKQEDSFRKGIYYEKRRVAVPIPNVLDLM